MHPDKSYEPRELTDSCQECGRRFDFPLLLAPDRLLDYRIVRAVGRGFYAATYVGQRGRLGDSYLLKVIPTGVYEYFGKDFERESRLHAELAADTEHVVKIRDFDDTRVRFSDLELECHVAVMDFVDGPTLAEFLHDATPVSLAQIAVDLFQLLAELENKRQYHNDLNAENIVIQRLGSGARRADAVEDSIRAVAVDLGSLADRSKSVDRLSDLHAVARHLFAFAERLLEHPEAASESDYRLAAALEEIGYMLRPEVLKQRAPDFGHFAKLIRDAFVFVSSPWRPLPSLHRFGDAYNAQTLHWSFVPRLLVDPDGTWLPAISGPGPQVITGMRGCGKTMLLRALEFHSRAAEVRENGDRDAVRQRIEADGYVGLYVSCTRLLDSLGTPTSELHQPYARLFAAYSREAVRALRHLRQIDRELARSGAHRPIGEAAAAYLSNGEFLATAETDIELERRLQLVLTSLARGEDRYSLVAHPTTAFAHLALAVKQCSQVWSNANVLFLLDDVTTRNLEKGAIGQLLSSLLFQSDTCAFKATTERQTLEELLRSPGLIEKARPGRDYQVFDLGAEVNLRLRPPEGKAFISRILAKRAQQWGPHPQATPAELLGDVPLVKIAERIRGSAEGGRARKGIYEGLSALAAVCVGDIGDVISIYEAMLRGVGNSGVLRVPAETQSDAYQDYCSRRLYHLNRRDGRLKDFALSFAQASHELLMRSTRNRLRQYTKVYVRLTTGDTDVQFERIRDLLDSGVFVLEGGSDVPRTKTRDADPVQQFVLTYRKLFGLSSFMGLSDRDRFELSGRDLEEWLEAPADGKAILLRNLGVTDSSGERADDSVEESRHVAVTADAVPMALFREFSGGGEAKVDDAPATSPTPLSLARFPRVETLASTDIGRTTPDIFVAGLGFEERTLESVKRILKLTAPRRAVLVRYREPGRAAEIEKLVRQRIGEVVVVDYEDVRTGELPTGSGSALVDVTGLAKPVLFNAVFGGLRARRAVVIAHTFAKRHYPTADDIQAILEAERGRDSYGLLQALDRVWSGEAGPYEFDRMLRNDSDESRPRLLVASASPKHQRLMSLVEERNYDRIEILQPSGMSARDQLARLAADVVARGVEKSEIKDVESNDLAAALNVIGDTYQRWYVNAGYDVEVGLTGSKLHAVAFAAACAAVRISECWYVRPSNFDPERFTHGVGPTTFFSIRMPD